jgi:16S rRNA G527 N7-methylase RsmG
MDIESNELLKALHILTRDGKMNADSRRKLKQVHHLSQLIEPLIKTLHTKQNHVHLVDVGAGKSYLGFILYDLVLKSLDEAHLTAIESRAELVEKSKALAEKSGFNRIHFIAEVIEKAKSKRAIDMVCALHACDTATDDAITFGMKNGAQAFALVPCCQAEIARELKTLTEDPFLLHPLYDFPIHRREFGSHLTNVFRTLYLRSLGFKVTVTELVGFEHSMKNELILAEKVADDHHPHSIRAKEDLIALHARFPVKMKLLSNLTYLT